jgi:hypothetical protein
MKKLLFSIIVAFAFLGSAQAQGDYKAILKQTFDAFDTTYFDFQNKADLGNKLVLIAKKFPAEWVTNYYAAYSRIQLSYMDPNTDKKDPYLDEADQYLSETIHLLGKETDETHVLSAMLANARMAVKPQSRWMKYGKIFEDQMDEAKKLNANNPRIYLQKGISKFYTPKPFGGGAKVAAPYFEKAQELFAKETDNDITVPYWGKPANKYFLSQLKKAED